MSSKSKSARTEDEHKSRINPNPQQLEFETEAKDLTKNRKRVIIPVPDEDEEEPIIIFETEDEQEDEDQPRARGLDEDEPDPPDILTPAQELRKNKVYKKGDIVEIEYKVAGEEEEQKGFGIIVKMNEGLSQGFRTAKVTWIYERQHLLDDNDELEESVLEEFNFDDGDYASSDHEQDVNVYNIVRTHENMRSLIKFFWDGTDLTPLEPTSKPQELPQHLALLKEWLLSYKPWKDTRLGSNWWWTINSLLNIGHATSNSSTRSALEGFFLDEDREPKLTTEVTWESIEATSETCDACGNSRFVTAKWVEKGWLVGKTCQARIDALYNTCKYMQAARAKAKETKESMSRFWLERVFARLEDLSKTAQLAIAGDHRG